MKVHEVEQHIADQIKTLLRTQGYARHADRKRIRRDTIAEFRSSLAAQRARGRGLAERALAARARGEEPTVEEQRALDEADKALNALFAQAADIS